MPEYQETDTLIRISDVLKIIPISQSRWWAGVREGRYPQPIRLGPRTAVWRLSDIHHLVETLFNGGAE